MPMAPDTFDAIIADVRRGKPVRRAIVDRGSEPGAFYDVLDASDEASQRYARAKSDGLDRLAEETIWLSDEARIGEIIRDSAKDGITITRADAVERAKLQVDTRKWLLSKLAPKKYGERVQQVVSGPDDGPVKSEVALTGLDELRAVFAAKKKPVA
jgi:hypothetical protein